MVRAWYMDDSTDDKHLPHMTEPPEFLDELVLRRKTGMDYLQLGEEGYEERLDKIKSERSYNYQDICDVRPEALTNYEETVTNFYREHIHADEEIRFCMEGSGYFDVRDVDDRWVRVEFRKGDLIILPPGIYHRFTLDTKNYIKLYRLFVGRPVWSAIYRPAEEHPSRQSYLKTYVM